MRQRTKQSSNTPETPDHPSSDHPTSPERGSLDRGNAFSREFLVILRRRERAPATPEADNAGPWTVVRLHGRETVWACRAAGETSPRARLREPDLGYLTAAALECSDHPNRFRLQEDAEGTLHLMSRVDGGEAGASVGTTSRWSDGLPAVLTAFDLLRTHPQALAHFLLAVDDQALARAGRILHELAETSAGD